MMKIIIEQDGQILVEYQADKQKVIIGQSPECDIVVASDHISQKHCEIECKEGDLFLTDFGTTNGTLIDGQKIESHKPVLYPPFLSLSLSGYLNVVIELGDVIEKQADVGSQFFKKSKKISTEKPLTKLNKKPELRMVFTMIVIIIIMGVAIFLNTTNENDDFIPALSSPSSYEESYH